MGATPGPDELHATVLENLAERIRHLVAASEVDIGGLRLGVTVSIGATPAYADDTVDSVIDRADEAMYRSKRSGGDRTTFVEPEQAQAQLA